MYIYRKENYVHNEEGNVYAAINIKETVQERIIILKAIKRGKNGNKKTKEKNGANLSFLSQDFLLLHHLISLLFLLPRPWEKAWEEGNHE